MTNNLTLTRYLYFADEVSLSLLDCLIAQRDLNEALFWIDELYSSGFVEKSWLLIWQIYFDFYAIINPLFMKKLNKYWKKSRTLENVLYIVKNLFHLINHCKIYNLKLCVTSSINLNNFEIKLNDLRSRLKSFYYLKINNPDDEMCKMLMTKLFLEKQIIIKHKEIFDFIFKIVERTYKDINSFVEKIDHLSLEKKRQLTIPLIKEIL